MPIDAEVRKRGFRRWYERQLVEGHAYLVTSLLSVFMVALALETIEFRASLANALALTVVFGAGGAVTMFAWRQFTTRLSRAQALAAQATCAQCRTFARFEVLDAHDSSAALTGRSFCVRCRNCGHKWRMG